MTNILDSMPEVVVVLPSGNTERQNAPMFGVADVYVNGLPLVTSGDVTVNFAHGDYTDPMVTVTVTLPVSRITSEFVTGAMPVGAVAVD